MGSKDNARLVRGRWCRRGAGESAVFAEQVRLTRGHRVLPRHGYSRAARATPHCLILLIFAPPKDASPMRPFSPKMKTMTGLLSD